MRSSFALSGWVHREAYAVTRIDSTAGMRRSHPYAHFLAPDRCRATSACRCDCRPSRCFCNMSGRLIPTGSTLQISPSRPSAHGRLDSSRDVMSDRNILSRRSVLALGAGSALVSAPFVRTSRAQSRTVYMNSYGGVWETSWKKAFYDPFTAQTGIQIKSVPGVSSAKLKAQVQSRNFDWNVINLGDVEYAQA